jgi:hypothetical protein
MSYRIEAGQIIFDTPPPEGAEISINVSRSNNLNGFSDPNSFYPRRVNEPDTNRLATNDLRNQHPVVRARIEDVDDLTGEPPTQYGAQYPYNHVRETESGHIQEFDDTPGRERIHEYHRTGTFYEVHPDGSKVTKVVGNDYEIVHKNKSLRVRGNIQIFVDGDASLYVRGEMDAQVDENLKFNVGKNIDFHAGKNIRMFANESMEITSQTTTNITAVGNMHLQTSADLKVNVGGDYSSNIKGNVTLVADGDGSHTYSGNYTVGATGVMQLDTESWMQIGAGSSIDIDGSTIDLNTNGRSAVTVLPATDLVFLDTGTLATGIKAWSIDESEYDTDGFAPTIDAPKSAEVLEPLPFVPLSEEDSFMGNDDEEKSPEELRAAVESGEIRPGTFSDYSYNALEGSYTLQNATRSITTVPTVSSQRAGDHGDPEVEGDIAEPEAGNTSVSPNPTDPANYDADGNMIGGVNYRLQLSRHFTLGQLSANSVVAKTRIQTGGNRGFTQQQIIDNLSTLANNALDLIKDQYPSMIVTNAYRGRQTGSQHNVGYAADMQFPGTPNSQYYDIAIWIRENVPHDQLILEYKTTGTRLPWIHISLTDASNRAMAFTMMNHSRVGQIGQFQNLA